MGGSYYSSGDLAAFRCHMIAMTASDSANEVMSPQQPKPSTDSARAAAMLLYRFRRGGVEQRLQVFVAQAVDQELATANGFQQ